MFSGFSPLPSVTERRRVAVHDLLYFSPPIHLKTERDTVSKKLRSARNSRQETKSRSQVILGTKYHRRISSQVTKTTAQKLRHYETLRIYLYMRKRLKSCHHLSLMWRYILIIPDTKNRRQLSGKKYVVRLQFFLLLQMGPRRRWLTKKTYVDTVHVQQTSSPMILGKWSTWCTNSFLCIYFYL